MNKDTDLDCESVKVEKYLFTTIPGQKKNGQIFCYNGVYNDLLCLITKQK